MRAWLFVPIAVLGYILVLIPLTPSTRDLRKAKVESPSVLVSTDGVVLASFRRLNRQWVPLSRISPSVIDALIATEDHRFFRHKGIDAYRTAASMVHTLRGNRQGGSTLTQQLARNLYPEEIGRSRTVHRKVKEAITALKIEAVYTKQEILETYLNTVPFLYNAYGIEMAARTYFDKRADQLELLESATLIGMLKGASYYNPVLNPERARTRRNVVLAQMARHGKLDATQASALAQRPLRLDFARQVEPQGLAPHVAQQVRRWLIAWADRNGYDIHADGLVVRTALHSRMQRAANQAVGRQMAQLRALAERRQRAGQAPQTLQAGFMAMDPRNGHVLAWVGSPDYEREQFDHVNQARRQPGSTFKPFVYAAAFSRGMRPQDTLMDQPVSIRGDGDEVWNPRDATPSTGRAMTLRDGLIHSRNSIAVQLIQQVGPQQVAELARAMGVRESKLDVVPSLALGTSPVTLREMVGAYGTIANNGRYVEPVLVMRIEDREGRTLDAFVPGRTQQALPRQHALTLVNTLRGVVDEGTGTAIRSRYGLQADVAGKTGTTQDNSDGWFILMHPQMVAGAWVGFNDNRVVMGEWGQGARSALPIVGDFFQQSLRNRLIDAQAEFDIPRPKPKPRAPAQDPIDAFLQDLIGRVIRLLQ